jgi:hypothetical protein
MLRRALLGVFGLLFLNSLVAARGDGKESWKLTCESVTVDTCTISCPCLMGLEPHHGACQFVSGFKIKEGSYGNVTLDGLSWAMMGEFTGASRTPKFSFVAFYLPKEATEDQKKALRAILNSSPFVDLPKPLGITELDVQVLLPKQELGQYELRIGDKGSFKISPVTGGSESAGPIKVKNPVYPFPVPEITVGRAEGHFHDHGLDLELSANSGEMGTFTLSSAAGAK